MANVHPMVPDGRLLSRLDHARGRSKLEDLPIKAQDPYGFLARSFLERIDEIDVLVQDQLPIIQSRESLVVDLLDDEDHGLEDTWLALVPGVGEDDACAGLPTGEDVDLDLGGLGVAVEEASGDPEVVLAALEELLQRQLQRVDMLWGDVGILRGRGG